MSIDKTQNGLVFIFTGKEGSAFLSSQQEFYNTLSSSFESLSAQVEFADGLVEDFATELDRVGKTADDGNLYIFRLDGGEVDFLEVKENPDSNQNWIEGILTFAQNYQTTEQENNMYKWGQKVPHTGEFLCVDCGYIIELEEGKTFPICEVCLSGEPDGPSGPEGAFWESV